MHPTLISCAMIKRPSLRRRNCSTDARSKFGRGLGWLPAWSTLFRSDYAVSEPSIETAIASMRLLLRRMWMPEEDALLRECAKSMSAQRAALRLKRTVAATKTRAKFLNIKFELKQQRLTVSQRNGGPVVYLRRASLD